MFQFYQEYNDTPLGIFCKHIHHIHPRMESISGFLGITVQIHGQPVKYEPNDCTYRIRIWFSRYHPSDRTAEPNKWKIPVVPEDFGDQHLIAEFSLSPTEDPIDLEKRYGDLLRKYHTDTLEPILGSFSAPKCQEAYIKNYMLRVQQILDTTKKEREPMENGHVEPRKKGYSHVHTI